MANKDNLPVRVKIAYSSAEGALSIIYTIIYMVGMFYFTDVAAITPAIAGAILMTGTISNAVFDPLAGMLSDRIVTPLGRRRAFLLFSALPYGITAMLLFTDFGFSRPFKEIYYFIMIILFFWCFSAINVPYSSLSAEITSSYDERTSLLGWRAAASQLGSLAGAGLPLFLVSVFTEYLSRKTTAWAVMGALFGLLCIPLVLITWRFTRGYERYHERHLFDLRELYSAISSNRSLLFTIGMYTFGLMAVTATGAVSIYYMTYYLKIGSTKMSAYLAIMFGGNAVWIPFIEMVSRKLSKRHAYLVFGTMWALSQMLIFLFVKPGHDVLFVALLIIGSSGLVAVFMIGWAMIPDCVDVDEYRTGRRREGLFYGIMFFIQKLICALVLFLIGLLFSYTGYIANSAQSDDMIAVIKLIIGPGIASLIFASLLFCYIIPLTRKRHLLLRTAMSQNTRGDRSIERELNSL